MKYLLITLFISGCASYNIEKNHPVFLDTTKGYGRIYDVKKVKAKTCSDKTYKFDYSGKNITIPNMNGYVCFKRSEVTENLADYDEYQRKQCED